METIIVIASVAVAGIVLLALMNLIGRNQPGLDRAYYMDSWQKIHIKAQAEETWALAVIDADKLLDHALRKKNFSGTTMAERMVSAKNAFSRRQLVWEAHKYRNQLVHEEVKINEKKVKGALVAFRTALKDLGAL
jgi:tRNA A37 N6-isopentenylltransferase MiaA